MGAMTRSIGWKRCAIRGIVRIKPAGSFHTRSVTTPCILDSRMCCIYAGVNNSNDNTGTIHTFCLRLICHDGFKVPRNVCLGTEHIKKREIRTQTRLCGLALYRLLRMHFSAHNNLRNILTSTQLLCYIGGSYHTEAVDNIKRFIGVYLLSSLFTIEKRYEVCLCSLRMLLQGRNILIGCLTSSNIWRSIFKRYNIGCHPFWQRWLLRVLLLNNRTWYGSICPS